MMMMEPDMQQRTGSLRQFQWPAIDNGYKHASTSYLTSILTRHDPKLKIAIDSQKYT